MKIELMVFTLVCVVAGCCNPSVLTTSPAQAAGDSTRPVDETPAQSRSVTVASCSNPLNQPTDTELSGQYRDLSAILSSNQVPFIVVASFSAGFMIDIGDWDRASGIINKALADDPQRWTRIRFNTRKHPRLGPYSDPLRGSLPVKADAK